MHGGPDAKQHSDDTSAKDVKGAAGVTTGLPMECVSTIAKKKRAHFVLCYTRDEISLPLPMNCVSRMPGMEPARRPFSKSFTELSVDYQGGACSSQGVMIYCLELNLTVAGLLSDV